MKYVNISLKLSLSTFLSVSFGYMVVGLNALGNLESSRGLDELNAYSIEWIECVAPNNFADLDKLKDIVCSFETQPSNSGYESVLTGPSCRLDDSDIPSAISLAGETKGIANPDFDVSVGIDRDELSSEGKDELNVEFCIRTDLIEYSELLKTESSITYHYLHVSVLFSFDGNFLVGVMLQIDPFYAQASLSKTYDVSAYQCELAFPHAPTGAMIRQNKNLGVCVVVNSDDSFLESIQDFDVYQRDGANILAKETYVIGKSPVAGLAIYNCYMQKPGSNLPNSMCFIETRMTSAFFENTIYPITAEGLAILTLRNNRNILQSTNIPRALRQLQTVGYSVDIRTEGFDISDSRVFPTLNIFFAAISLFNMSIML
mmetsp:Transcript_18420/g.21196  ORF Transcript_18420/g.21196 Transcript_18420/m.21196 type:complete len:373 (+) Transcript_18420:108-1226(+)